MCLITVQIKILKIFLGTQHSPMILFQLLPLTRLKDRKTSRPPLMVMGFLTASWYHSNNSHLALTVLQAQ